MNGTEDLKGSENMKGSKKSENKKIEAKMQLTEEQLEKVSGGFSEDDLPGYYDDRDGQGEDEDIIPVEEILRRLS